MTSTSFGDGISNTGIQLGVNNAPIYFSSGREEDPHVTLDNNVLSSLAFPQMLHRRDNIEPPHANTCEWILELDEYKSWKSQKHGLLWIKGKPGAGKSTLMAFLHDRLEKSQVDGENQGIRLDFFFSARGAELQRTPLGMFRSLLNQIFLQDIAVRPRVREAYDQRCKRYGSERHKFDWPLVALEDLLANVVLDSASQQPVVVFVDALDETGAESAQQLATYFHRLLGRVTDKNLPVQICISCRHYPIMATPKAVEIHVEDHNRGDISTYIKDTMIETTGDTHSQKNRDTLVDHLTKRANGVFQWVHLILPLIKRKIVEGESIEAIYAWLRGVPVGLKDVYTYVLSNVIDTGNREHSLLLFQWVCLAERPLTIIELRYAFATSDAKTAPFPRKWENVKGFIESDDRMRLRIMALSGGLVEVVSNKDDRETVQVVHQSVNDFLHAGGLQLLFNLVDSGKNHGDGESLILQSQAILYRSCLVYFVMASIPQGFPRDCDVSPETVFEEQPLLVYSTQYIFVHAEKAAHARVGLLHNEQELLQYVAVRWEVIYESLRSTLLGRHLSKRSILWCSGLKLTHMAAAANLVDVLERIELDAGDLMETDNHGNTALHSAARSGHKQALKFLYEKGLNRDAIAKGRPTPFIQAAASGKVDLLEWILYDGPGSPQNERQTALCEASSANHPDVVEVLLDAGTDPNSQGGHYGNPLQGAAMHGNSHMVRMLLDAGAVPNIYGGHYGNALQAAAYAGSLEVFQILLDAEADPDIQGGRYGNTLQAAAHSGNTEMIRMLLGAGADPHIQSGFYGNVLQAAAHKGTAEMVQVILDTGADPNTQGGEYGNALQAAAASGDVDKVQMLLAVGAEPNSQGGHYGTALCAAASGGFVEVARILLDIGANPNARGNNLGNALQIATYRQNLEVVRMLIGVRAHVDTPGGDYGPALVVAVYQENFDLVRILLNAGANPLGSDDLGRTSLHFAALNNDLKMIHDAPEISSPINTRDKLLQTPLHIALGFGYIEFARKLLQLGADPFIQDSYGRNAIDWASGHEGLILELQNRYPEMVLTPEEIQKATVRQSILHISETLFHNTINNPWSLLRQLGRLFLFLDEEEEARFLFRLGARESTGIRTAYAMFCDLCGRSMHWREYVCRECATIDICPACAEGTPSPFHISTPHRKEHKVFEVVSGPYHDDRFHGAPLEKLQLFLASVIPKYAASANQTSEDEPLDDSMAGEAPQTKIGNSLATTIGPVSIAYAAMLAALAFLLRCCSF